MLRYIHMGDEGVSGKEKKLTRREFVRLGTLAAAGAVASACTPGTKTPEPTTEPLKENPPEPIEPPTRSSEPSSPEPPPTTESEIPPSDFSPEPTNQPTSEPSPTSEPPSRSAPDQVVEIGGRTVEILCLNNPVGSAEELTKLREEISANVEISEIDPKKRGLELCVSKQAWEMWKDTQNPDHPMNGEELIPFIVRHLDELNVILDNSGLPDVDTYLKRVIIRDEVGENRNQSDLKTNSDLIQTSSDDVFGSWKITSEDKPKETLNGIWHDPMFHEWSHYLLFIRFHFANYFDSSTENFLPKNQGEHCKLRVPEHLKNFLLLEPSAAEPLDSLMLYNAHQNTNNTCFSQIERLYFLRTMQESDNLLNQGQKQGSDYERMRFEMMRNTIIEGNELSSSYHFFFPSNAPGSHIVKAKLYESHVYRHDDRETSSDNIYWQVDEDPICEPSLTGENDIMFLTIEKDLVKGGAKLTETEEEWGIAKLFMLELIDKNGERKVYAFTTHHLNYWTWKEQEKQALAEGRNLVLGADGPQVQPVIILAP